MPMKKKSRKTQDLVHCEQLSPYGRVAVWLYGCMAIGVDVALLAEVKVTMTFT
jgi:hypothetical protein